MGLASKQETWLQKVVGHDIVTAPGGGRVVVVGGKGGGGAGGLDRTAACSLPEAVMNPVEVSLGGGGPRARLSPIPGAQGLPQYA